MTDSAPAIRLIGATGMVGRAVIGHFGSTSFAVLARREVEGLAPHHLELVAPSERWADIIAAERPAVLISCLCTTIRQAGSKAAFRAVDHELVLAPSRGARAGGKPLLMPCSPVGAHAT